MPVEWMIIFMGTIAACAHFSYQRGERAGQENAVDSVLYTLSAANLIDMDDDGNITAAKK